MKRKYFSPLLLCCVLGLTIVCNAQPKFIPRWQVSNNGLYGGVIRNLLVNNDVVFASIENGGVYRSRDNGVTWESVNIGLPHDITFVVALSSAQSGMTSFVYASTDRGLFRSADNGTTWQNVSIGLPSAPDAVTGAARYGIGYAFASERALGSVLLYCTYGGGVYRSTDGGLTWQTSNSGFPLAVRIPNGQPAPPSTVNFATLGDSVIVGTGGEGVFVSVDAGRSWSPMNQGLEFYNERTRTTDQERNVYSMSKNMNGTILLTMFGNSSQYRWDNTLKRWQYCSYRLSAQSYAALGSRIFATQFGPGMYRSDDKGMSMSLSNAGMEEDKSGGIVYSVAANERTRTVFAGTSNGVFRSLDGGATWQFSSTGLNGKNLWDMSFDKQQNILLASSGDSFRSRIFRSTDGGSSWTSVFGEQSFLRQDGANVGVGAIRAIVRHGNTYFAGASGLMRSDDNGATWRFANENFYVGAFQTPGVEAFCSRGAVLLTGGTFAGIMRSRDNGTTWDVSTRGMTQSNFNWVNSLAQNSRYVFAVQHMSVGGGGVYRSSDDGASWERIVTGGVGGFPANTHFGGVVASGDTVWVAMNQQGIFRSTDNGTTWHTVNNGLPSTVSPIYRTKAFASVAGALYLCCVTPSGEKIFRSTNGGNSWKQFDAGVSNIGFATGVVGDGNAIFLGSTSGFYRLQNTPTSVRNVPVETASILVAPNPLRGNGHITYRVQEAAHVRISLVNTLGQVVEVLHDAAQSAGEYSLSIESNRFATGVYSVQLEAGASTVRYNIVIAQ